MKGVGSDVRSRQLYSPMHAGHHVREGPPFCITELLLLGRQVYNMVAVVVQLEWRTVSHMVPSMHWGQTTI